MKKSYALLTNLYYTKDHEWLDPKTGKVGITDYAQDQLKNILSVDFSLPTGKRVSAHQAIATIKSTETIWELHAPLAGTLAEINLALLKTPDIANRSPYKEGWLFRLDPIHSDPSKLLDAEAYLEITEG